MHARLCENGQSLAAALRQRRTSEVRYGDQICRTSDD